MSLESATYVGQLVNTNPTGTDPKSQGDDHLRLIKSVLQNTFPGMSAPLSAALVPFTPVGGIAAQNVQAALAELDSEKQAALGFVPLNKGGDTMTGLLALAAAGVRFNDSSVQETAVTSGPLSDRGSFQLPGGVRGQYGSAYVVFDASGNGNLPYNSAFPNTAWLVSVLSGDAGVTQSVTFSVLSSNLSGAVLRCIIVNPYSTFQGAARVNWLALGS